MNDTQTIDNTQDTAPESPVSQQPVSETVAETLSKTLAELQPNEEENNVEQNQDDDNESSEEVSEEEESEQDGNTGDSDEETGEEEGKTQEEVEPLEPPKHWNKEFKEKFNQLEPLAQHMFMDRHKDLESDYTKKTQQIAQYRKRQEAIDGIIKPYMGDFERLGMDEVGAIRQLFAAHDYLKKDPKKAISWLATNYGVDLTAVNDDTAEDDYADPEVKALKQQVAQLEGFLQKQENQRMQSEQQSTQSMIDQFASAKDENGNLKYPHFDNVRKVMGVLIQTQQAQDLEAAYDMAVHADPNLRKSMIDNQVKKASKSQVKTEAVQKAKKSQRSTVRGSATPAEQKLPGNLTIRETIQQSINQLQQGR